jgi:hypothetical protein
MPTLAVDILIEKIKKRRLDAGGFPEIEFGPYRPDATAWAVLALQAVGVEPGIVETSRARLARSQLQDGRILVSPSHPDAHWPTPLAVLAWRGSIPYLKNTSLAVRFLLENKGVHWKKRGDEPSRHDTSLQGWPWIAGTHSWIEPTGLVVIALKKTGYLDNPRVKEAVSMILDRQLPKGGWNYGNTVVFESELMPMPDSTGLALNALAGLTAYPSVAKSLVYLKQRVSVIRSPFSLGWSILGLSAWGARPANPEEVIGACIGREERMGNFGTTPYCLLLLASIAKSGFE